MFFVFNGVRNMNEYMTVLQASEKWQISRRRVNTLCQENRIEGAVKFGKSWTIPVNTEKPKDARIKNGKYIKSEE